MCDNYLKLLGKHKTIIHTTFAAKKQICLTYIKILQMEFYEVLEKRRTYRDFSDREVSGEILKRVIGAAFKAPTNDHLRQFEFVVVRGKENIAKTVAPLAKNMAAFKKLVAEVDESGDKDKMAMFADSLPQAAEDADGKRTAHSAVLPPAYLPAAQTDGTKFAQLLCFGVVCVGKHAACRHLRRVGHRVPYSRER